MICFDADNLNWRSRFDDGAFANGIQRLAEDERIGEPEQLLLKDNHIIKEALACQERLNMQALALKNVDPHADLPTNMLSPEDSEKAIRYVLSRPSHRNWQDFVMAWTGSERTFVRNHSMRQFMLPHLLTLDTHGPCTSGQLDREAFGCVYEPGGVHKEKQKRKRIVGVWRHRKPYQCFAGMVGMSLFVRFYGGGGGLHFEVSEDTTKSPDWWSFPLIENWASQNAAHDAYDAVLKAIGVSWKKVLHMRSASIEYASSIGELTPEEIGTMTKHMMVQKALTSRLTDRPSDRIS